MVQKIKIKNLSYIHILKNGSLYLGYRKRDLESGKEIDWSETLPEKSFNITCQKQDWAFKSVMLSGGIAKLINKIESIKIWPNNYSNYSKENNLMINSVIINLLGESISFDSIFQNDHQILSNDITICF